MAEHDQKSNPNSPGRKGTSGLSSPLGEGPFSSALVMGDERISLFEKFIENSGEGMGWADLEGNIRYANAALCRMLGEDGPDSARGKSVLDYYGSEDAEVLASEILPLVLRHGYWQGELSLVSRTGESTPTKHSLFLLRDPNGEPHSFANVLTDLTERKLAESELASREERLEELVEERAKSLRIANDELRLQIDEREKADRARMKLEEILDATTDFVAMSTADGRVTYINRAGRRMLGLGGEASGRTLTVASTHPEWAARTVIERALPAAEKHGVWRGITAFLNAEGHEIPTSQVIMVHRDEEGRVEFFSTIARDLTEQKRSEEKLQKSESTLKSILQAAPIGIGLMEGRTMLWSNDQMTKFIGYAREEFEGKDTRLLYPDEEEYQRIGKALYSRIDVDGVGRAEGKMRRKDGKIFDASISVTPVDLGGEAKHFIATVMDITERKNAERRLRFKREFEKLILEISTRFINLSVEKIDECIGESMGDIGEFLGADRGHMFSFSEDGEEFTLIYMWDSEGKIKIETPFLDMKTKDHPWWIGKLLNREYVVISSPDDVPEEAAAEREVVKARGTRAAVDVPIIYEEKVTGFMGFSSVTADRKWTGDELHLLTMASQIFVNAMKRKEAEREKQSIQAQFLQSQKMESIGRLAGGVAHDFNNQLLVIRSVAEMIKRALPAEDPLQKKVAMLEKASQQSANLTKQLLTFSRRQVIEPRILKLGEVLEPLEKMLDRLLGDDVSLDIRVADDEGYVKADPTQVEQVVVNLAVNAKDAMPGGGQIVIETMNVELSGDWARGHPDAFPGPRVMLAVSDNGEGIPREYLSHIFEPFFTTKEMGKGTGLGLATVYGIVKQFEGDVQVYSEPGIGTTFKIYLPRVDSAGLERDDAKADEAHPLGGSETVLVVEDEPAVRGTVVDVLEMNGYSVIAAESGEEALRIFGERRGGFDIIVTDVVMKGMSGKDLATRLTEIDPNLKILYMSGYTDDVIVHHGILEPGIEYIQKPFRIASLLKKVRNILDSE